MTTLDQYLRDTGLTEAAFALQVKTSQAHVNRLRKGGWPGKALSRRIKAASGGQVTANDFLDAGEPDVDQAGAAA